MTHIADPPVCSGGGPGSDAGVLDEFLREVTNDQMIALVLMIMTRSRTCLPSSKWVVLHIVPGLLVGGAGVVLELWQSTVTSHCLHHITRGVAIMLLLPTTVRDCQGNHQWFE